VRNDGGIFDLVRQGKDPVEEKKEQEAGGGCNESPYEYAADGPFFDMSKHVIQSCPTKDHKLSHLFYGFNKFLHHRLLQTPIAVIYLHVGIYFQRL